MNESKQEKTKIPEGIPVNPDTIQLITNQRNNITRGAILVALGLGLLFAFGFNFVGWACSILFFIGVSKIVISILKQRDLKEYYRATYAAEQEKKYREQNFTKEEKIDIEIKSEGSVPPPFPGEHKNDNF